jgi:hypothetical protein
MSILVDTPDRHVCPACGSHVEKPGFYLVDDQAVRQFRCQYHTIELLRLALQPLQSISTEM